MTPQFQKCLDVILRWEGGYVDHPRDPGGATNMGITFKTLQDWRKKPVTKDDVRALTKEEAAQIYFKNYWLPIKGDDLPRGINLCVFNQAVMSGTRRAARMLQRLVGAETDGIIGGHTISLAFRSPLNNLIKDHAFAYLDFLQDLDHWDTFGRGWTARIDDVKQRALRMAAENAV